MKPRRRPRAVRAGSKPSADASAAEASEPATEAKSEAEALPTRLRALRATDRLSPTAEETAAGCPNYRKPERPFAVPAAAADEDAEGATQAPGLPPLTSAPSASPRMAEPGSRARMAEPGSPPLRMTIDPTSPLLHAACRELTASPPGSPPRSGESRETERRPSPNEPIIMPTPKDARAPSDDAVLIRDDAVLLRPAQRPRAASSDAADPPRPLRPQPPRTAALPNASTWLWDRWHCARLDSGGSSTTSQRPLTHPKSPERVGVTLRPARAVFGLPGMSLRPTQGVVRRGRNQLAATAGPPIL